MKKILSPEQRGELLEALEARFAQHMHRHVGMDWAGVRAGLEANPAALWALREMEQTGGEPDVVVLPGEDDACVFCDCAPESPMGRRNLCYDRQALEARKKNKPAGSAVETAEAMDITLLTEAQYRALQALEPFDTKTSSWIETPEAVRSLGGALFCDRRYGQVFVYHNGADSYYAARGFRGMLRV